MIHLPTKAKVGIMSFNRIILQYPFFFKIIERLLRTKTDNAINCFRTKKYVSTISTDKILIKEKRIRLQAYYKQLSELCE
jgi:hypothetical protein